MEILASKNFFQSISPFHNRHQPCETDTILFWPMHEMFSRVEGL